MNEKIDELYNKTMMMCSFAEQNVIDPQTSQYEIRSIISEAVAYGRSSALAEVERELPIATAYFEYPEGYYTGYGDCIKALKSLISSKRVEEGK